MASCQTEKENPAVSQTSASQQEEEKVLNLTETSEIPTMDSVLQRDNVSGNVMNNVFEGLYRQGEEGEIVPGMAEDEPEVSEDGMTYVFTIRDDAFWSDGSPVTAEDFVFAWRRLADPDTEAAYSYLIEDLIKNADNILAEEEDPKTLGVKAIDAKHLEVQLTHALPYFKSLLTLPVFYPQNEAFFEEKGETYGTSSDDLVYNGPFVLSEWDGVGLSWVYKKNDTYWDAKNVNLDEINVDVVKENYTGLNLYYDDMVDQITLSGEAVASLQDKKELTFIPTSSVYYLKFNQERDGKPTPLANQHIRKGIAMAFDKEGFVSTVLQNGSIPTDALVPQKFAYDPETGEDFRNQNGSLLSYQKQKAQQYFAKGLKEIGKTSLQLEIIADDTAIARESLEYLQKQLTENLKGLDITITNVPFYTRLSTDENQDYDIQLAGWSADYADPLNFLELFTTDNGNNHTSFSDNVYDHLIAEAETSTLDLNKRWQTLLEAEKRLMEEAAIAPVYQQYKAILKKDYVQDVITSTVGPEYTYKWTTIKK